jgi:hypothetical protein
MQPSACKAGDDLIHNAGLLRLVIARSPTLHTKARIGAAENEYQHQVPNMMHRLGGPTGPDLHGESGGEVRAGARRYVPPTCDVRREQATARKLAININKYFIKC